MPPIPIKNYTPLKVIFKYKITLTYLLFLWKGSQFPTEASEQTFQSRWALFDTKEQGASHKIGKGPGSRHMIILEQEAPKMSMEQRNIIKTEVLYWLPVCQMCHLCLVDWQRFCEPSPDLGIPPVPVCVHSEEAKSLHAKCFILHAIWKI